MKIRGYNCPVKQLTVPKVDELAGIGLKSYRCVEPYGFASDDHIAEVCTQVIRNRGECIVTLFNSNQLVLDVLSPEARDAIYALYTPPGWSEPDYGKAARLVFALGVRTRNKEITDWMIDEALRLRRIAPPQAKIEIFNPDVIYYGTDWQNWRTLKPEFVQICRLLTPNTTPTYTGFNWLRQKLNAVWYDLWAREVTGGFLYGEKDRIDRIGSQTDLMEFGANVHDCPQRFYELLPTVSNKRRVYCQWIVDPAFDGYSNVTPEMLFDAQQVKELYQRENYPGDAYCLIPTLGYDAIRAFAAS